MKFYNYLQEARKNPELNPKISIVDALRPYKDRDDVYISYTDINKLGINPINKFKTPTAIYTYSLKEMWSKLVKDNIPFASDRKYIQVFSCPNSKVKECVEYTKNDWNKDFNKLIKILPKIYKQEIESILDGVSINDYISLIYERSDVYAYSKHPFSRFWWTLMTISIEISWKKQDLKSKFNSKAANIWAKILRELGYFGFSDKQGEGFIHTNEPIQSLFLSTKYIKHIDSILNKTYKGKDFKKYSTIQEVVKLVQQINDDGVFHSEIIPLEDLISCLFGEFNFSLTEKLDGYKISSVPSKTIEIKDLIKITEIYLNSGSYTLPLLDNMFWKDMLSNDIIKNKSLLWTYFAYYLTSWNFSKKYYERIYNVLENLPNSTMKKIYYDSISKVLDKKTDK